MPKFTAEEKLDELKKQALQRGLKIRCDPRLTKTPYRAMQPYAGKELNQPYIEGHITYEPRLKRQKGKLAMDINHEIIEYDKQSQGWCYKKAHRVANKKQRSINMK